MMMTGAKVVAAEGSGNTVAGVPAWKHQDDIVAMSGLILVARLDTLKVRPISGNLKHQTCM